MQYTEVGCYELQILGNCTKVDFYRYLYSILLLYTFSYNFEANIVLVCSQFIQKMVKNVDHNSR